MPQYYKVTHQHSKKSRLKEEHLSLCLSVDSKETYLKPLKNFPCILLAVLHRETIPDKWPCPSEFYALIDLSLGSCVNHWSAAWGYHDQLRPIRVHPWRWRSTCWTMAKGWCECWRDNLRSHYSYIRRIFALLANGSFRKIHLWGEAEALYLRKPRLWTVSFAWFHTSKFLFFPQPYFPSWPPPIPDSALSSLPKNSPCLCGKT